ncbi:MAG: protein kinase, partial [Clostridia bacterium]|nr:protein kinase [Deltaproteobacteria bacterium]
LDYAHRVRTKNGDAMGIVHCDVTPSNVFIAQNGQVRLGDFGVAHSKLIASAMAERGWIAGKASYLAPEQIHDETVSPATDVFALGSILFEMIAGRKAFNGKTTQEVMNKIVDGNVSRLSAVRDSVSPEVERIVHRALTIPRAVKVPTRMGRLRAALPGSREPRYATAAHLAIDLETAYDQKIGTAASLASLLRSLFK